MRSVTKHRHDHDGNHTNHYSRPRPEVAAFRAVVGGPVVAEQVLGLECLVDGDGLH